MTWLMWRQHRHHLLAAISGLMILAAASAALRGPLVHYLGSSGLADCLRLPGEGCGRAMGGLRDVHPGDINYLGDPFPVPDTSVDEIQWLLDGTRARHLRHLGLKNSPIQDAIAAVLAHAPVVAHLEVLDLSFGTFSDEDAAALLAGQPLTHLKRLDLRHNFMTESMRKRLVAALPGVEVRATAAPESSLGRYVAISE